MERKRAGFPQIRYGFGRFLVVQEGFKGIDGVPRMNNEAIDSKFCKELKKAMGDEMQPLENVGTSTFADLPI